MLLPSIMRPERGLSLKLSGSRMSIPCLGTRTTPRQQRLQQGKEQPGVGHGGGAFARRQVAPTPLDSQREAGDGG